MCGICGCVSRKNNSINIEKVKELNKLIIHRGPDCGRIWTNDKENIALGHRRLSILDLSESASLPMCYMDRYVITYNGEIYNYIELKKDLINYGYSFNTTSDTEVILASYDKWGKDMLCRFNGMWSFALYDIQLDELFISRDRFGIKPLYYYIDDEEILFASEMQAIDKLLGKKHNLNNVFLESIASGNMERYGSNYTYLENVFSLNSGENFIYRNNIVEIKPWYTLKKQQIPKRYKDQVTFLKKLIYDSIKIRMRSDVSIGTCLSGGIDSGSITSVIADTEINNIRYPNFSHKAFCAAFDGTPIDESKDAIKLAKEKGVILDVTHINCPSPQELESIMKKYDGPMWSLAFYPIYKLYESIKNNGITVTLDGQGPDEMLGGYNLLGIAIESAWKSKNFFEFVGAYNIYSKQGESSQLSSKKNARKAYFLFFKKKIIYLKQDIKTSVKKILNCLNLYEIKVKRKKDYLNKISFNPKKMIEQELVKEFFYSPLPGILQQFDRCSMLNSIECRMPFMDYRIVEFIFSLPNKSRIGKGYTKRILRDSMKDVLPDFIRLNKTKIGFNAPIVDWFRGPLRNWMIQQMKDDNFINNTLFDGKRLFSKFQDFLEKEQPTWNEAWEFWGPVHVSWWQINHGKQYE